MKTTIIVPARFASVRLPGKPLAEIGGVPMVVRVARRGLESDCGTVTVATDDARVLEACQDHSIDVVMTSATHPSGSDRVHEALGLLGFEGDAVIVLQGDLPLVDPAHVRASLEPLKNEECDIATLATLIGDEHEARDPNVVKIAATPLQGYGIEPGDTLRAVYFSRSVVPSGEGPLLHHIGLYAYRTKSLRRFVSLPPGGLEQRERLEQLRALENGMRIDVMLVDGVPLGVDSPADLAAARAMVEGEAA